MQGHGRMEQLSLCYQESYTRPNAVKSSFGCRTGGNLEIFHVVFLFYYIKWQDKQIFLDFSSTTRLNTYKYKGVLTETEISM